MGHWEGWTRGPTVGIPRRFDPSADQAPALASARPGATHDDPLQRKALPRPRFLPAASRPIASLALAAVLAGGALPAPVAAGDVAAPIPEGRSAQLDTDDLRGSRCGAVAAPAAPGVTGDDSTAVPDLHPSIAYEQAMAHEHDRIDFKPGGRVTVGFTPRARRSLARRRPSAGSAAGGQGDRARDGGEPPGQPVGEQRRGQPARQTTRRPDRRERDHARPSTAPAAGRPSTRPASPTLAPPATADVDLAAASGLRRQVFGFLPYWELSGASTKLNNDVLSTIAYFSVGADRDGNLRKKDPDGTNTTGWGGWTSSNMTSVISSAHQHGTRVVLTVSVFAWTTAQANVQRAILGSARPRGSTSRGRSRPPSAIAAPTASTSTSSPSRAATRTSSSRCSRPSGRELNKVRKGYQLTYDTTGFIGNYPLEASVGRGRGRRDLHHGLRLPHLRVVDVAGSDRPAVAAPPTTSRTPCARTRPRVSPSRGSSSASRGTAGPGRPPTRVRALEDAQRRQVRLQHRGELRERHRAAWRSTAAGGTPLERSPYVAYRRQNCTSAYGCVTSWRQVYYDDVASLKQRYAIVNDYGLRGAGMWALGYDGGHSELYRAASESFLVDKSAPQAGIRMPGGDPGRRGVRRLVGGARHERRRLVRRPGLGRRRRVGHVADARRARRPTSGSGADGHGYAFRVRAVDRKGNAGSWNVGATWDASPSLATGGFGRVVDDGLSYRSGPDTQRGEAGHPQGRHDRRDHARAGVVGRLRLVRGHRADPRVVAGVVRGARRLDRGEVVLGHDGQALSGAQQHHGRRRPPRPRLRVRGPRLGARLGSRRAGDPRVLAERRRVRGRHPAAVDATPSPSTR